MIFDLVVKHNLQMLQLLILIKLKFQFLKLLIMLRRICVGLVDDGEMNLEGIETIFERDHRFDGVR